MKTIRVNMAQMKRWKVDQDNVRYFDSIMRTGGTVLTLDAEIYTALLCGFNIFYTVTA